MSRFRHINRSRKLRKESRTIPLPANADYGNGEDVGKYYRCWYCGFICDVDRDSFGNDNGYPIEPETYTQTDQYGTETYHCEGAHGADQTACEAAGGTWTSRGYKPGKRRGCPLCGTMNYIGN